MSIMAIIFFYKKKLKNTDINILVMSRTRRQYYNTQLKHSE